MNTRILLFIAAIVVIALIVFGIFRASRTDEATSPEPTSFEECASRYPVMESFPRRCVTPSGLQFTETATTTISAPTPSQPPASGIPNLITVTNPTQGQKVSSPLTITGEARGNWYFEASFPVEIRDSSGQVLAQASAQAKGDWMTTDFVPFRATLTFPAQTSGSTGTLILRKDNPSGDPARDQSISIPVTF